jgi:hypothetical protein
MPLYELVLQFPDGREETRYTEGCLGVGDNITVAGRTWEVIAETLVRSPEEIRVTAAFLCTLTKEQRSRAVEMRIDDAERRFRIEAMERQQAEHGRRLRRRRRRS